MKAIGKASKNARIQRRIKSPGTPRLMIVSANDIKNDIIDETRKINTPVAYFLLIFFITQFARIQRDNKRRRKFSSKAAERYVSKDSFIIKALAPACSGLRLSATDHRFSLILRQERIEGLKEIPHPVLPRSLHYEQQLRHHAGSEYCLS